MTRNQIGTDLAVKASWIALKWHSMMKTKYIKKKKYRIIFMKIQIFQKMIEENEDLLNNSTLQVCIEGMAEHIVSARRTLK